MNRLAVFELHHLGDAVMAIPFLRGAEEKFDVTVLCREPVAHLLRECGLACKILAAPVGWAGLARRARSLALGPADAAACVWADTRAHLLMALSGAGTRAGLPMITRNYYAPEIPWRRRRLIIGRALASAAGLFRPLLTVSVLRDSPSQHHMQDWEQLAESLRFVPRYETPWIKPASALDPATASFLEAQQGRKIVLLHPGGRLPAKRWPFFDQLARRLADAPDLATVIVRPPGEPAPAPCGARQFACDAAGWPQLLSLFHRADAAVCNDSAAAHLAAAMGKPVVAIFGSGNPDWFSPWGNRHLAVAPEGKELYPIIDHGAPPGSIHLDAIPVELVESRLRTALNAG
jgi:ADP-heptose:LPS heptosyltransferase